MTEKLRAAFAVFFAVFSILLWPFMDAASAQSSPAPTGIFDRERMSGVMSFNLRLEGDEGDRAWALRQPLVADIINEYRPLFVGTQEGKHGQLQGLQSKLDGYAYVGVSRRGNTEDEYSALFYDTERVEAVQNGNFWLSEAPDVAGSTLPASGHPRMVTWGEFKVDGAERSTFVFNTHVAEQPELSAKQTAILLEQIGKMGLDDAEVIITGDFNVSRTPEAIKPFTDAGYADAYGLAQHSSGPDFTFHGWKGEESTSTREAEEKSGLIYDWIFYRNGREKPREPLLADVITTHEGGVYPSDHYPVILTSLGRAKTATESLHVSADGEIEPDSPVTARAMLHNTGERGIAPATLMVDGEDSGTKWMVLNANESREAAFDTRFYAAGEHRIAINDTPEQALNVAATPATLRYTDLSVSPYLRPNQEVQIQTTLRNSGSADGSTEVTLAIDGEEIARRDIAVPAGERQDVEFAHRFAEPGNYTITVGDRETEVLVAQEITSPWLFAKGDDAKRAAPDFDASDWQQVELPSPWEQHSAYTEDNCYGWYRTSVMVPKEWEGRPVQVLLGVVDDVDESFFNGKKAGQSGNMPDDKGGYKSAATTVRAYTISPEDVRYGEENVIAIRAYDSLGDGGITKGPLGILPLKAREQQKWTDRVSGRGEAVEMGFYK